MIEILWNPLELPLVLPYTTSHLNRRFGPAPEFAWRTVFQRAMGMLLVVMFEGACEVACRRRTVKLAMALR